MAFRSLPVVNPDRTGHFGGLETSAWLTAKALATIDGVDASLISRYHFPVAAHQVDEVEIVVRSAPIEILRESLSGSLSVVKRFPWLQINNWSPSLLWKIPCLAIVRPFSKNRSHELRPESFFRKLDVNVLCLFGVSLTSAKAMMSVDRNKTKALLFVRSNAELDRRFSEDETFQNDYGERSEVVKYAIQNADTILVQTEYQRQLLAENFGRESEVIGNPFDLEAWDRSLSASERIPELGKERYVLWVGRPDHFHKRPQVLIEVAKRCPEIPFMMVLNQGPPEVRKEIESAKPDNVTILDHVPFSLMPAVFQSSALYVFTGTREHEGLPNVLLQAAATSKPILGFDYLPDSILMSEGAAIGGSVEKMAEGVQTWWGSPETAAEFGKKGRLMMEQHLNIQEYARHLLEFMS